MTSKFYRVCASTGTASCLTEYILKESNHKHAKRSMPFVAQDEQSRSNFLNGTFIINNEFLSQILVKYHLIIGS